jgi:hypothetical protein
VSENTPRKARFSVGLPAKSITLHFEPMVPVSDVSAEVEAPFGVNEDGERLLGTLNALVEKVNECEALFGRPGLRVNGERSGLRDGRVLVVVGPNDPTGAVETCKRIADQLFAALRTVPGITI